eukprot:CAMPEP_0201958638 /NCGR_PEP_ID=MMETSP0904-20121228/5772_1 /ASSEMBLY_ACC=CAM_ASM_000553 /TAXON_ID=420261 /ORGANISM="Thalassiosira antarctica, Strain CCMP982" /LENGTH=30 /DNA_ID= /DNA_START= /DNA_END= /DNA_ORIENTATION=
MTCRFYLAEHADIVEGGSAPMPSSESYCVR